MIEFEITSRKYGVHKVLVDDEDAHFLTKYKWHIVFSKTGKPKYVMYSGDQDLGTQYLHRLIAGAQKGQEVDHANRNSLDNTRANLRICSRADNVRNRVKFSNGNKYKGVWESSSGKFRMQTSLDGVAIFTRAVFTEEEAAKFYDKFAKSVFGEFAVLNFPEEKK